MSINFLPFVGLGIALLLALAGGILLLVLLLANRSRQDRGGWVRLVERYGTPEAPAGTVLTKQTLQIGSVVYRESVTVGIAAEGLYITTWRKTVLIPWSEFGAVTQGRLFWERVPVLSVGHPAVTTITLPLRLFDQLRGHLPAAQKPST